MGVRLPEIPMSPVVEPELRKSALSTYKKPKMPKDLVIGVNSPPKLQVVKKEKLPDTLDYKGRINDAMLEIYPGLYNKIKFRK